MEKVAWWLAVWQVTQYELQTDELSKMFDEYDSVLNIK